MASRDMPASSCRHWAHLEVRISTDPSCLATRPLSFTCWGPRVFLQKRKQGEVLGVHRLTAEPAAFPKPEF